MSDPKYHRNDTWDRIIFSDVASGKEYGAVDVKDKVVFDVGAHIGGFTEYAVKNGAKFVYAFEANKDNFDLLEKNVGQYENVVVFNNAVWWNETDTLSFSPSTEQRNTGGGGIIKKVDGSTVLPITLKAVVEKYEVQKIDVLKLDCEGSEFPILYSMDKKTLKKVGHIVGEYHNQPDESRLYSLYSFDEKRAPNIDRLSEFLTEVGFTVSKGKSIRDITSKQMLGLFSATNFKTAGWSVSHK